MMHEITIKMNFIITINLATNTKIILYVHTSVHFFSQIIKDGMRILEGGVATGLQHITHDKTPKLYIVKGKRQPTIRQLQPIQWSQFNDGDAFCIDAVDFIFVWNGKLANRLEKLQAAKVSKK